VAHHEAVHHEEVHHSDSRQFQELLQQGLEAVYRKRYEDAIELFKQCRKFDPIDPTPAYNLACCYSLKRDIESGIKWMTVAIDLGLDYEDLAQDPDLENMFHDPRFQELWNRMRNLSADVPSGARLGATALPGASSGRASTPDESLETPDTVFEGTLNEGVEAVARGDHQEAVRCFSNCLRLRPEDAACAYNLTCCYALMNEAGTALQWFRKAVDWGLAGLPDLDPSRDSDLRNLTGDRQFLQLVDELKEKQQLLNESAVSTQPSSPPSSFSIQEERSRTGTDMQPQPASVNPNSSLDAQSWAAVKPADLRAHSSAPVGFDQRHPQERARPLGGHAPQSPQAAWASGTNLQPGLERDPQDVLGNQACRLPCRPLLYFLPALSL
jgi:tetratricopeptide (TPR) repeat protein